MVKIALIGKAGSGKSTILKYLEKEYNFVGLKIAEPIYDIATEYFDMKGKDRGLLQFIGNGFREYGDGKYKNIWIDYLMKAIKWSECDAWGVQFVIDDCRFKNEFNTFKEAGWVSIGLNCPVDVRRSRMIDRDGSAQLETLNDVSETEMDSFLDQCNHFINTNGSYEENYEEIDQLMNQLGIKRVPKKSI